MLDHDALGRQLGCERVGPGAEEGFAARVDGKHGGRRGAGERADVQDESLLSVRPAKCERAHRKGGGETDRETMEGAMRLVMRSVAATLTLLMVTSSSGGVSTKSVGNSCDTPTLLTVFFYTARRMTKKQ